MNAFGWDETRSYPKWFLFFVAKNNNTAWNSIGDWDVEATELPSETRQNHGTVFSRVVDRS